MTAKESTTESTTYNCHRDKEARTFKVALFGTFDVDNFGDCLFPLIVEHHLTKRLGKIQLYPFSPTNRVARIGNYSRVYAFKELTQTLGNPPSCFIIGGGELLRTEHNLSTYPEFGKLLYPFSLRTWLLPIMVASAWNCPSILNAVGMGPDFNEDFNELASTYLQKLSLCYVRDKFTAERLSRIKVKAKAVPDSALSISDLFTSSEWLHHYNQIAREFSLPEKFLAVQCSFSPYHAAFSNAIARVSLDVGLPVVLVPICHFISDIESLKVMRKVLRKQGVKTYLINRFLNTTQTSSVLSMSELYIGTSLHGALVSLSFGKPVVSFSPSKNGKHIGVLTELGLQICRVSHPNNIPESAIMLLNMPKSWFAEKSRLAKVRIDQYYDQFSDVIRNRKNSSIPPDWSQDPTTGEIRCKSVDGFRKLTQLCLVKKQEINFVKRCLHYIIRKSHTIGARYDRLMFWLRENGFISHLDTRSYREMCED